MSEKELLDSFNSYILCSDCFQDHGLSLQAKKIGIIQSSLCSNCKSSTGSKLSGELIQNLSYSFFVQGSISKGKYGAYPIIQFNYSNSGDNFETLPSSLKKDMELIESSIGLKFFYYGPRLWMIGENEPLKKLQNRNKQKTIIDQIIKLYPIEVLDTNRVFYRLRKNPLNKKLYSEYDSPPPQAIKKGRLESSDLPILYCSQNIDTCIHECRATAEDDLYLASLNPTKNLRVLNLTKIIQEEDTDEFESLDIAVHMLFMAAKHSYKISREIAVAAHNKGLDGIIYPSYFSSLQTGEPVLETILGISIRRFQQASAYIESQIKPNIALFGRPIQDKKVTVSGINRIVLKKVIYDFDFGPVQQ